MSKLIQGIIVLALCPSAFARMPIVNKAHCAALLLPMPTKLDYFISDFEGIYLELLEKVQAMPSVPSSRSEAAAREVLALKAQVLNNVGPLLASVNWLPAEHPLKAKVFVAVYHVIGTLGVPPKVYGLNVNEQNQLEVPAPPELPPDAIPVKHAQPQISPPIGFLKSEDDVDRDLPDHLRRSIGFGEHVVEHTILPYRKPGNMVWEVSASNEDIIVVTDLETKRVYNVDYRYMSTVGFNVGGKIYSLAFNRDMEEWIMKVDNPHNPTGRIGFH